MYGPKEFRFCMNFACEPASLHKSTHFVGSDRLLLFFYLELGYQRASEIIY